METVPTDYKVVTPYIKRAHEVRQADKPLQYWCLMHAAQLAMTTKTEDAEAKNWLYALVDRLEALKDELGDNQVVTDMVAGQAYVENLALKIFTGADTEDRAGKASQGTVKKFLAAADFLDLLTEFGSLESDIQEKLTYARWKATDIARALREGRKPHAGPIQDVDSDQYAIIDVGDALGRDIAGPSSSAGALSSSPMVTRSMSDAQGMNVDTPIDSNTLVGGPSEYGAPGAERPGPPEYPFPASQAPSAPSAPESFAAAQPPPPPPHAFVPAPAPAPAPSDQPSAHTPFTNASAPSHTPAARVLAPSRTPVAHAGVPAPADVPRTNIDSKEVAKAQKHARWAISALDYDDYPTARKELLAALAILG